MCPGKCSEHFCDHFAVWKYCRSDHIKIISLVIPSSTIDSCRPDNQKLPSKLAPNLVGNREPLTFGRLQGISIRYLTVDASLSIHIVFACCVVWHLGLDEAVSPLQFFPNCVSFPNWASSGHQGTGLRAVIWVVSPPLRLALCDAEQDVSFFQCCCFLPCNCKINLWCLQRILRMQVC